MPDAVKMYQDGSYVNRTGNWHLGDASFKANEVLRMIAKHQLQPKSICDIGCGAGGVLHGVQQALPSGVKLTGYEKGMIRQFDHFY